MQPGRATDFVTVSIPASYWLPPLISGATTLALAILVWVRRPSRPAVTLGFYLFSIALWSFGYCLELRGVTVEQKLFWSKVEYFGPAFMPLMGLIFVLEYTGNIRFLRKRYFLAAAAIPVITQVLAWTNEMHGWVWERFWVDHSSPFPLTGRTHGPWFWVFLTYGYVLAVSSMILLFRVLFRRRGIYRWQAAIMLIGCMIPFAGNAMYSFGIGPFPHLDLTVFAFSITGLSMTWGLFGLALPRIIPVARDTVIEGMSDGVVVLDLAGNVIEVNPEASAIFGRKAKDIVGRPAGDVFGANPEFLELCRQSCDTRVEITVARGSTRRFDVRCSVLTSQLGRAIGSLIVLRDITEREAAQAKLRQAHAELEERVAHRTEDLSRTIQELRDAQDQLSFNATHDSLTGLANRKMFLERLSDRLQRALKENDPRFAILFLDVDRFKLYNDGYGHTTGDLILIEIGQRLRRCFRESDTVARMGGDEFTVLIEHLDQPDDAYRMGERFREALALPFRIEGRDLLLTGSIGVVVGLDAQRSADEIVRDADLAMYRAKRLGGNKAEVFEKSLRSSAVSQLQVEQDLRLGIQRNELVVRYQPFVRLGTGEIVGFEALVRWRHPERGLLPPGEFLPIAEQTGMIMAIDDFVLREACRQQAQWQEMKIREAPFVSVNVSAWQFLHTERWWQGLCAVREFYKTRTDGLRLEITEGALIANPRASTEFFEHIRDHQLQIYLDDFGTGYSSFSRLSQFPIRCLKIDRSFVNGILEEGKDLAIVRSIVALGHSLGMEVVAEGIELRQQAESVHELGCEYGQGFYYSKPVDADTATALLAAPMPALRGREGRRVAGLHIQPMR